MQQIPSSSDLQQSNLLSPQQQQQNGSIGGTGQSSTAPNSPPGSYGIANKKAQIHGGRFDFEDGGTYCGGWEEGKAHGYGVCTGPKHQGAYAGAWNYGFEVSGVYIWPSGSSFEGQWQNGRRHGAGVEHRGRLIYRGEWTSGYKGRYGVRQSTTSNARYEGTWANGLQDGYGSETYADGGYYQGQWLQGKRHGYGVRTSAPFGLASHYRPKNIHSSLSSLRSNENADPSDKRNSRMDDVRGGFVLKARSDEPPARRNSLGEKSKKGFLSKIRKQRSTGDLEKRGTGASGSIRSTVSTASWISTGSSQSGITTKSVHTDSNASFTVEEEQLDPTVVETYMGEWNHDKRNGYGISERSDGLKYEGEWSNNKKHGYGITTFRDGTQEEGKYKNNILITSQKKKHLFLIRSRKFRERIEAAVSSAQRASKYALQKADIAISRTTSAREKAEFADNAADHARIDCETAVATAREFAPDFKPSVLERFERLRFRERYRVPTDIIDPKPKSALTSAASSPSNQPSTANKIEPGIQPQLPQQSSTSQAFQQQTQSIMNRRPSAHPITKQPSTDYSTQVPNQLTNSMSMYSQISPQTDLSQQISQQESNINPTLTQSMHHQQTNPSYQFQQQQPPGVIGNYAGSQQVANQSNQMYGSNLSSSNNPGTTQYMQQQQMLQQQQQQQQMYQQQQQLQQNMQYQQQQPQQQYQQQFQQSPLQQQQLQQQQQQQQQQQPNQMYTGYNTNLSDYQQQQQQQGLLQHQPLDPAGTSVPGASLRRNSRLMSDSSKPMLGTYQQSSIDYFDHYKRPPSRDSSVDRYARATSRMSGGGGGMGSRQPSVDRTTTPSIPSPVVQQETPDRSKRAGSQFRGQTPSNNPNTGNGAVLTGTGAMGSRSGTPIYQMNSAGQPVYSSPNQPFEDVLLRRRTLGQDIIPSPSQPKRTESLFVPVKPATPKGGGGGGGGVGGKPKLKSIPINVSLQRKKSLPDVQELPRATEAMSREEVSALGSARREEIRRQIENSERLKANPLLYLVSPQVKDWFSRQQLVLLVLVVNVALAIMFFKMLT